MPPFRRLHAEQAGARVDPAGREVRGDEQQVVGTAVSGTVVDVRRVAAGVAGGGFPDKHSSAYTFGAGPDSPRAKPVRSGGMDGWARSTITIAAPRHLVMTVIADFAAYPAW